MKVNNPLKDEDHHFLECSKQVLTFFICVQSKMVV